MFSTKSSGYRDLHPPRYSRGATPAPDLPLPLPPVRPVLYLQALAARLLLVGLPVSYPLRVRSYPILTRRIYFYPQINRAPWAGSVNPITWGFTTPNLSPLRKPSFYQFTQ